MNTSESSAAKTTSPHVAIDRRTVLTTIGGAGLFALAGAALGADEKPAGGPGAGAGAGAGAGGGGGGAAQAGAICPVVGDLGGFDPAKGEYILPKLPYDYKALEPHIDAQTMEIHYTKHHAAYVAGLNKAAAELAKARAGGDFGLVKHWSRELAFNGGGHLNHSIFWATMAPPDKGGGGKPAGKLADDIARDFSSYDKFTAHFSAAAAAVEGGGWCWLMLDNMSRRLIVQQMEKQQNMLLTDATPLLGIDVWEHAYYLKYQNKRADYIKAWWNVVNWGRVQSVYDKIA